MNRPWAAVVVRVDASPALAEAKVAAMVAAVSAVAAVVNAQVALATAAADNAAVMVDNSHRNAEPIRSSMMREAQGLTQEGTQDGTQDGTEDRAQEGTQDGTGDRAQEGTQDGTGDGTKDGTEDRAEDGTLDGTEDRAEDGTLDGTGDGTKDVANDQAQVVIKDQAQVVTKDGTGDGTRGRTQEGRVHSMRGSRLPVRIRRIVRRVGAVDRVLVHEADHVAGLVVADRVRAAELVRAEEHAVVLAVVQADAVALAEGQNAAGVRVPAVAFTVADLAAAPDATHVKKAEARSTPRIAWSSRKISTSGNQQNGRCVADANVHRTIQENRITSQVLGVTMRSTILAVFGLVVMSVNAFAMSSRSHKDDSTNSFMMEVDFDERTPMVSLFYGSATPSRDGISGTIEQDMTFGGTLGMGREKAWFRDPSIIQRYSNNVYLWYGKAADAQNVTTPAEGDNPAIAGSSSTNLFRVGLADESGFGYKLGESSNLMFLASNAVLSWTAVTPQSVTSDPTSAQALRDFEGALRFGEAMRPTIEWRVTGPVSIRVGYEWSQIYPRHMFWYWALSQGIEGIADAGATWFAREIGKSSPAAMPIVYFILKNGVAAGFKALRMNQMNWPFTTVAPMNVHMWNVGIGLHF